MARMSKNERGALDRARGALTGMACGDALGALVEFRARGTFKTPTSFRDGGPHRLRAGMWTDDTAMALHLADHLIAADLGAQPDEHLLDRWVGWYRDGNLSPTGRCFDVGNRTRAALECWARERRVLGQKSRPFADGNGAVMRVAPVAVRWSGWGGWVADRAERRQWAHLQATYTHGRIASKASVAVAEAVALLICGADRAEAVAAAAELMTSTGWDDPREMTRAQLRSGGHALDTTESALWCLENGSTAEEVILLAVQLGHDSDTTAAVAGALAGARWGHAALPKRWTKNVWWGEHIVSRADALWKRGVR